MRLLTRVGAALPSPYTSFLLAGFITFIVVAGVSAHEAPDAPPEGPREFTESECTDLQGRTKPGKVAECGDNSAMLPTHLTAVHSGLVWKTGAEDPSIILSFRFTEYSADDIGSPELTEEMIDLGALSDPANNFNSTLRPSFQQLAYGGYNMVQGLSKSVPTRIDADQRMELVQLWDLGNPAAFANNDKYFVANLVDDDFELNLPAFSPAGFSSGLVYNIYCAGHSTLSDGRVVYVGGHDMNSNNGLYKVNVFDPDTETWEPRTMPPMRGNWEGAEAVHPDGTPDPYHERFHSENPDAFFEGKDPSSPNPAWPRTPEGGTVAQPSDPSDMRYARWYPTAITLPDDKVLILGGDDQNESLGPDPGETIDPTTTGVVREVVTDENGDPVFDEDGEPVTEVVADLGLPGLPLYGESDIAFKESQVQISVPEVYDPETGETVALENARMIFSLYPAAFVVQTGPSKHDWKVAVMNGHFPSDVDGMDVGGAHTFAGPHRGRMYLLDVQAALADPDRDVPGENHWTLVDEASASHGPYVGHAYLTELDHAGNRVSDKAVMFGGYETAANVPRDPATGDVLVPQILLSVDTVSMIDFADPNPQWEEQEPLLQPAAFTHATPLPDGTVFIGGGVHLGKQAFEERNSLRYQIFDPDDGSIKEVAKTTVPRFIHGTVVLLPDGRVLMQGDDRTNAVQRGDAVAPLGDEDLGVPTGQIYSPPYLFNEDGSQAARPEIVHAPDTIRYNRAFKVEAAPGADIDSVVMIRTGIVTHSLSPDYHYVKLPFIKTGHGRKNKLIVKAPRMPSQAIAGHYMLFVLNDEGVPSVSKHVQLLPPLKS